MKVDKKRKEVVLNKETIEILELKAERAGRTLKNYMEFVLLKKAEELELEDEAMAIEIRTAIAKSRVQSASGQTKLNKNVIEAARQKVNAYKVDKAG